MNTIAAESRAAAPRLRMPGRTLLILALITLTSAAAIMFAMTRTSTTFDEIVMIAAGARGLERGEFNLAPEHPPLVQYLYGLPVYLSHPNYPPERSVPKANMGFRYMYAQEMFWLTGNNPEKLAFLGRLMAVACAVGLVLLTYSYARQATTASAALVAAALVAFLPDVLAHGGVSYNDLPLALSYFAAVWALDAAVRRPSLKRGGIAGALCALAVGVKFSAVALLPVALVLVVMEAITRTKDTAWWKQLGTAVVCALIVGYLALVLVYRGDFALADMRYGLEFTRNHVENGHGIPTYLLGQTSKEGFWYFYPVAFLFKTPVALHLLIGFALIGAFLGRRASARELMRSRLRAAFVGAAVFTAFLLASRLAIGFRYAMPVLPLLLVIVAAGLQRFTDNFGENVRRAVIGIVLWYSLSSLSWYPNYLAFTSEYVGSRDDGHEVLIDSSLDWGQGLLQLRDFMRENNIPRVYLAYFGSGMPGGYGIRYVPLLSFFQLHPQTPFPGETEPQFGVISATLLHDVYTVNDPYRKLREAKPVAVIGHTMFVYKLD